MVRTYGQMPRQLLRQGHVESILLPQLSTSQTVNIYPLVRGLRWGIFTGSPQLPEPLVYCFYQQGGHNAFSLVSMSNTNVCYAIPEGWNIMQGSEPDTMNIIMWQQRDGIVRIRPLSDDEHIAQPLLQNNQTDEITACGTDTQSSQLWIGHTSGKITVYQCVSGDSEKYNKNRFVQHSMSFTKMSYNSAFRKVSSKGLLNSFFFFFSLNKNTFFFF